MGENKFRLGRADIPDELIEVAARAGHDAYEAAAVKNGWMTQKTTQVPWDDLPAANKRTMLAAYREAIEAMFRDNRIYGVTANVFLNTYLPEAPPIKFADED